MDERQTSRAMRAIVEQAMEEARRRSAPEVGAEHVLLALATDSRRRAAIVLAQNGLDYIGIERALEHERTHSLAVAGVEVAAMTPPAMTRGARDVRPGWGASAKEALLRAGHASRSSRAGRAGHYRGLTDLDILVGILQADLGRVPRALELAGHDRAALVSQATA